MKFLLVTPLLLFVALPIAFGSVGSGTVIIRTTFGNLHGLLQEASLQGDKITMNMIIDDKVQEVHVEATAIWIGSRVGQAVSGTVRNFTGTARGRSLTIQADWSGTLSPSLSGNGTLAGILTVGVGTPIDGTWTATFITTIPEFASIPLVLATITSLAIMKHPRIRFILRLWTV